MKDLLFTIEDFLKNDKQPILTNHDFILQRENEENLHFIFLYSIILQRKKG